MAPALVEANESSIPVLGITSDISVSSRGHYPLTELDQDSLFKPLTKWNIVISRSDAIPSAVRRAMTVMTTGRPGAVHLGVPIDVQRGAADEADVWVRRDLRGAPAHPVAPDWRDVEAAAELLRSASRPLLVCGGGPVIAGAFDEVRQLAETLGAIVTTSISGKGVISERHQLAAGVVGSNGGTVETRELVNSADVVLFVGCRAGSVTTEKWQYPDPERCKILHLDVDPVVIGATYPVSAPLVGDARSDERPIRPEPSTSSSPATSRSVVDLPQPATVLRLKTCLRHRANT